MLKVAFIGQKGIPLPQYRVERYVEELALRLAKNGHEIFVYTRPQWVPKEYKQYEQVNLISLPSWHTKNLDAITHTFLATLSAIFKEKVDIIHYHGVGPSLLAWLPKILKARIKVVATLHAPDWQQQKWGAFARLMLKLGAKVACKTADETIAVTRDLQKYCLIDHKSKAAFIPQGVSVMNNKEVLEPGVLGNFNLEPQKYILATSAPFKNKGMHYLIDAFKTFKEKNLSSCFKLVIAGPVTFSAGYQQYLIRLTQGRDDIVFAGNQSNSNLDVLFKNTYLYVTTMVIDNLPFSALEAMAYGKAVLVPDVEENLELIAGNSKLGAIGFEFKNTIDLANKINLLVNDPQLVYKVGKKAQQFVNFYYNWQEITERVERIYKNIVLIKDKVPSKLRMVLARYVFFL